MRQTTLLLAVLISAVFNLVAEENDSAVKNQFPTIKTNTGHARVGISLVFTPDGTKLVSASFDGQVKIWSILTGKEIRSFVTGHNVVTGIDVTSDGKVLATVGYPDQYLKLWNIEDGKEIASIDMSLLRKDYKGYDYKGLLSVKFFPDGGVGVLAMGAFFKIDFLTKQEKWSYKLTSPSEYFQSFDISPNGTAVFLGLHSGAGAVEIDNQGKYKRQVGDGTFLSLCVSPDGSKLLSGGYDVKLWDIITGQAIATLGSHNKEVTSLAFSPDGKFVLSSARDSLVKQYDLVSMKEIAQFNWHKSWVRSVKFSPDGLTAGSAGDDLNTVLWNTKTFQAMQTLSGLVSNGKKIDFSNDGKYILTTATDRVVLWDVATAKPLKEFKGHTREITDGRISPDTKMVVTSGFDRIVRVWNIETGKLINSFTGGWIANFSLNSKYVLSDNAGQLIIWDVEKGAIKCATSGIGSKEFFFDMAFTPDGKYVLATSTDKTCRIWDIETGKLISLMKSKDNDFTGISIATGGKLVLLRKLVTYDVELYDFDSGVFGRLVKTYAFKTLNGEQVSLSKYSPDGKQFVVVTSAKKLGIQTNVGFTPFTPVASNVQEACYSPDGKKIATIAEDGGIGFWDVDSAKLIVSLYLHKNGTDWLAITPDGYFDASNNGGDMVSMVQGNETFGIEQFSVRNNRPDIILKRIGLAKEEQIDHLYAQHQKRLRKLGFVNALGQPSDSALSVECPIPKV